MRLYPTLSVACASYHINHMFTLSHQMAKVLWLWVISVFYGCHMTLFIAASYILWSRWRLSSTQRMLFVLIIILFIMSTAATVIAFTAVFVTADVLIGGPGLHRKKLCDILGCVIDIIADIVNVITDGLVIWRCYIICGRRLSVVTVMIALLVTGTALGWVVFIFDIRAYKMTMGATLSELLTPSNFIWSGYVITYSNISFWTISAVINLLATVSMGCQIRRVSSERKRIYAIPNRTMSLILNLMIESGVIYLVSIFVTIVVWTTGIGSEPGAEIAKILPCIAAFLVGNISHVPRGIHRARQ
ncbi:hypothetical protein NEOLEDRAFT_932900 [Neolentinus lepideus HHB14362 ss-1]|uniref:Uncharacterized protein n=1 Tax=Neolentinus lepideus HHB14362 ss-1 TaxID=1314782 RepID=A0A165NK33_9AGAM|nr:hypothetical protein NEOLEDRAFT_932900 [Neolentinus lepideus HHB14362 ss-1]